MITRSYSSTVTSTSQLVTAAFCTLALNVLVLGIAGPRLWPVCVAASVLIIVLGLYQGVVSLIVGPDELIVGRGPWHWPARRISTAAVISAEPALISWPQVFGFGRFPLAYDQADRPTGTDTLSQARRRRASPDQHVPS